MTDEQYRICKRIIAGITFKLGSKIDVALHPEELAGDAWESAVIETQRYDPSQGRYDSWIVNRIYTDIIDRIRTVTKYRAKTALWAPSRTLRSVDDEYDRHKSDDAIEEVFDVDDLLDLERFLQKCDKRTVTIFRMRLAGLSMTEVGHALDLSCARISQILKATRKAYDEWREGHT